MHHLKKLLLGRTLLPLCARPLSTSGVFIPGKQPSTASCPFSEKNQFQASTACPFRPDTDLKQNIEEESASVESHLTGLPFEQIPCPLSSNIPFGTNFNIIRAGGAGYMHQYCDKQHQTLGPIYRVRLSNVDTVFLADAKLVQKVYKSEGKYPQHLVPQAWIMYNQIKGIQRGLFFMDGEKWANCRRTLNKSLLMPQVISEYTPVFNDVVSDMLAEWNSKLSAENQEDQLLINDLEKKLYNWSIESLGTMIFGRRMGCVSSSEAKSNLPDIHEFVHCVQQIFVHTAKMQVISPKLAYNLKLPTWKRFEEAAGKALQLASQYVNESAGQISPQDGARQGIIRQMMSDGQIELEEISQIIVDLFIAAADTTSHATQWALYLLSRNKHVQQQLYHEIQQVTQGEPVQEKHLQNLSLVKGVIKEALRLYPVAPFLTRYLAEDLNLNGYLVPKGQLVVISLYTMGRMQEYFSEPSRFLPERWIRDKETGKNQVTDNFACLPFGLGVRSCIGRRVGEVQMQFLISRLVQQFHILPASKEEIDIKLRMITTPEKAIDLFIKRRQSDSC